MGNLKINCTRAACAEYSSKHYSEMTSHDCFPFAKLADDSAIQAQLSPSIKLELHAAVDAAGIRLLPTGRNSAWAAANLIYGEIQST